MQDITNTVLFNWTCLCLSLYYSLFTPYRTVGCPIYWSYRTTLQIDTIGLLVTNIFCAGAQGNSCLVSLIVMLQKRSLPLQKEFKNSFIWKSIIKSNILPCLLVVHYKALFPCSAADQCTAGRTCRGRGQPECIWQTSQQPIITDKQSTGYASPGGRTFFQLMKDAMGTSIQPHFQTAFKRKNREKLDQ